MPYVTGSDTVRTRGPISQPSLSLRLDKYQNIATALSFDNVSVMRCFIFDNVFVMRYSIFNNNAKSRPLRVIIINK